jgi:hypothetical protein
MGALRTPRELNVKADQGLAIVSPFGAALLVEAWCQPQ